MASYPDRFEIVLGSNKREGPDPSPTRLQLRVRKIIMHENYRNEFWYWGDDIALFLLSDYIDYNDNVKPACLPSEHSIISEDTLCYTSGWGKTDYGGKYCTLM